MADIRPIPYSVGQYEAQVFDLSGMARVMAQQEAIRRKTQAEAKKEADKVLSEMSATMAKGRTQELPYLRGLYNDVANFYNQNAGRIQPGTNEYQKYTELKGKFNFEAQRSINEKESDKTVAAWMAVNSDKQKIGQGSLDYWKIKQLPINNPDREAFKFKKSDGTEVPIDQVNLPDLQKYDRYDENETRKDIETIKGQEITTKDFIRNYKGINVPLGTLKTNVLEFKQPSKILQAFDSKYMSSLDAEDFYNKSWNSLSQKDKDDMNKAFSNLNSIYSSAGIKETVKVDEKDGIPGISNGYEFGAAKFLLQNLPETVKEDLNFQLANIFEMQAYRSRMLAFRREAKIKESLDTGLAKAVIDSSFDVSKYSTAFNRLTGKSGENTGFGSYIPARIRTYDKVKKEYRMETAYPVFVDREGSDGKISSTPTQNFAEASAATGLGGWKKGATEWLGKDSKGNYIRIKSAIYNINPRTVGYENNIIEMNNAAQEALRLSGNKEGLDVFKGLRTTGATMTPIGGQAEDIIINQ